MDNKRAKPCIIALAASLLLLAAAYARGEEFHLTHGTLTFSPQGQLTHYITSQGSIELEDITLDAGIDGEFLLGSLGFQRFYDMNTWELAALVPKARPKSEAKLLSLNRAGKAVEVRTESEGMVLVRRYEPDEYGLRIDASIASNRAQISEVQGIALSLRGITVKEETTFRFPGNTPYKEYMVSALHPFSVRSTDYCAPLVRIESLPGETGSNLIFLHEEEKWSTGLWRDPEGRLNAAYLVMAEGLIRPDESWNLGSLYLQISGKGQSAHHPVQQLYAKLGYRPPRPLEGGSGPFYSLHPAGTMDRGMNRPQSMAFFSSVLSDLQTMGIRNLWLLPIFEHSGRGVYEPVDQAMIDPRYGTDEDMRLFTQTAHQMGMRVLLDYVPHGPYPTDPLAAEHPDWCSVHRSGRLQEEWNCVSFDMLNPGYLAYTKNLSADHSARFDTDGGRIDCAMGGLSNWRMHAADNRRASSSGLRGGLSIIRAIREGYVSQNKIPLLLPENFHPLPAYAIQSDVFYDMPLYRALFEMRANEADEKSFAISLAGWLEDEYLFGVPGQQRLRFLGNHDTVSWTWDKARPTEIYGVEKAKALWTLFALIDGAPLIYQGDEYSPMYDKRTLIDLRPFFSELYSAREEYLRPAMDIRYERQDSSIIAFSRRDEHGAVLGLVNLGGSDENYLLPQGRGEILYGSGRLEDGFARLPAYGSLLIALN